jgi:hypothetical protein
MLPSYFLFFAISTLGPKELPAVWVVVTHPKIDKAIVFIVFVVAVLTAFFHAVEACVFGSTAQAVEVAVVRRVDG